MEDRKVPQPLQHDGLPQLLQGDLGAVGDSNDVWGEARNADQGEDVMSLAYSPDEMPQDQLHEGDEHGSEKEMPALLRAVWAGGSAIPLQWKLQELQSNLCLPQRPLQHRRRHFGSVGVAACCNLVREHAISVMQLQPCGLLHDRARQGKQLQPGVPLHDRACKGKHLQLCGLLHDRACKGKHLQLCGLLRSRACKSWPL